MVDHQSSSLDLAFGALSDRTRRAILFQIGKKESTVTELAEPHDMTIAAVSKHLMVLERAGLIVKTKEGRSFRCRLNPAPFKDVNETLELLGAFWADRLDSLETYFKNKNAKRGEAHENVPQGKNDPQRRAEKNHSRQTKRGV
jgi:DNA-binding transcriptional ArsR family regulator